MSYQKLCHNLSFSWDNIEFAWLSFNIEMLTLNFITSESLLWMLYPSRCRLQEIIDFQLVINSHWWWIWYISWMIDLKFVDCAASELTSVSSSAYWTALAAAWCKFFDSDKLFDFDNQIQSSYQDNDKSDWDS